MGRHKKVVEEPKKFKEPKKFEKWRCKIGGQSKDFNSQDEARRMALDVLNTGKVFFLELSEVTISDC